LDLQHGGRGCDARHAYPNAELAGDRATRILLPVSRGGYGFSCCSKSMP
jgi:hypothetical protein